MSPRRVPKRTSYNSAVLFHYTSFEALTKIVPEGVLHATDVTCLNDGREITYALDLFEDELRTLRRDKHVAYAMRRTRVALSQIRQGVGDFFRSIYAVSFSSVPDLLSQWRAYCPGGSGVALGFDVRLLRDAAKRQRFELVRCLYRESQQRKLLQSLLHDYYEIAADRASTGRTQGMMDDILAAGLAKRAQRTAAAIKHPSFAEEREWRLVFQDYFGTTNVKFRAKPQLLVPYLDFALPRSGNRLVLPKVIIGPTPHAAQTTRAVRAFLESHKVKCKNVAASQTSFRLV